MAARSAERLHGTWYAPCPSSTAVPRMKWHEPAGRLRRSSTWKHAQTGDRLGNLAQSVIWSESPVSTLLIQRRIGSCLQPCEPLHLTLSSLPDDERKMAVTAAAE